MKAKLGKSIFLLCLAAGVIIACSKPIKGVGTEWILVSLNGHDVIPGRDITATFADKEITGYAGCNSFNIDGVEITDSSLVFQHRYAAMTDLGCSPEEIIEQEKEYITTLVSVTTYSISDGQLEMKNKDGDVVLIFK
jgi:heat shock protein HslJ